MTLIEVPCLGCPCSMQVHRGQIAYYHTNCPIHGNCRALAKRIVKPQIEAELHKKRPWWFWLWLWTRRMWRRITRKSI